MKKSAQCATVCVNNNQAHKEADEMKWCKSGSHLTEKDRFMIQKIWDTPDHLPHVSVREVAKKSASPREAHRLSSPNSSQERSLKCVSFQPDPAACVILLAFFNVSPHPWKNPSFGYIKADCTAQMAPATASRERSTLSTPTSIAFAVSS